jgi:hypothetical protein
MSTYSSNLRLNLIASGAEAGTWGNTTNYNLGTLIEAAISGVASVSVASTNQVLSANNGVADESRDAILQLNAGGVGGAFNIFAPPVSKMYAIFNNTPYDATIWNSNTLGSTTAAGSGVTVKTGDKAIVFSNATNFYGISASAISGTVPIASGGTGQTTQQAAINALAGATTSAQFLRGNGTNVVMSAIQAADVPTLNQNTTGNAATATTAGSLTTANFSIVQSGSKLYFKYGSTNIASLDSSGNLVILLNVTGYGTP